MLQSIYQVYQVCKVYQVNAAAAIYLYAKHIYQVCKVYQVNTAAAATSMYL